MQTTNPKSSAPIFATPRATNGSSHQPSSLTRQGTFFALFIENSYLLHYEYLGSLKKTGIPVLAARSTPVKIATPGRSTSAIDLQAANRAKQHHFSTLR
jgi:hypothetical protein